MSSAKVLLEHSGHSQAQPPKIEFTSEARLGIITLDLCLLGATGVVLESAPNFDIKKKLKLVGEPYKIFKNTAFIKNMFSSDIEVC